MGCPPWGGAFPSPVAGGDRPGRLLGNVWTLGAIRKTTQDMI